MKERILDVASQLIARYGLKKFTIDEIAGELKISKKTIYRYFDSKDKIIHAYFTSYIESDKSNVIETIAKDRTVPQKIHSISSVYFKIFHADRQSRQNV